jgi:hypothetical protein
MDNVSLEPVELRSRQQKRPIWKDHPDLLSSLNWGHWAIFFNEMKLFPRGLPAASASKNSIK